MRPSTKDLHPVGCARLLQAVIAEAHSPRYKKLKRPIDARYLSIGNAKRLEGLLFSPAIDHLAAVMDWDPENIRDALARRTTEWYDMSTRAT